MSSLRPPSLSNPELTNSSGTNPQPSSTAFSRREVAACRGAVGQSRSIASKREWLRSRASSSIRPITRSFHGSSLRCSTRRECTGSRRGRLGLQEECCGGREQLGPAKLKTPSTPYGPADPAQGGAPWEAGFQLGIRADSPLTVRARLLWSRGARGCAPPFPAEGRNNQPHSAQIGARQPNPDDDARQLTRWQLARPPSLPCSPARSAPMTSL